MADETQQTIEGAEHNPPRDVAASPKERVEALKELIDNQADNGAQVHRAAREMVQEARHDPNLAKEVNATKDPAFRSTIKTAVADEASADNADKSRDDYIAQADKLAAKIEDPDRRDRAQDALKDMRREMNVERVNETSKPRERQNEFEAER